ASRASVVAKNIRTPDSRSSTAVGEKSSSVASSMSVSSMPRTSSAGQRLAKHVLDAIEQVAFVLRVVAVRPRCELLLRQRHGELLEQMPLFTSQLLRRLHLHRGKQIAAA